MLNYDMFEAKPTSSFPGQIDHSLGILLRVSEDSPAAASTQSFSMSLKAQALRSEVCIVP
jgi:hypothetical protein